jgi:hypothetical protein
MGTADDPRDASGDAGVHAGSRNLSGRQALYVALSQAVDLDGLHDLIATKGMEILELPFPYLVVAARNRVRDRLRRQAREDPSASANTPDAAASPILWDPLELVMANDELRRTLEALAAMDDRDVLVVWLSAQGSSDEEIVAEWDSLGFAPSHPTLAAVRKRRERARAELRRRVDRPTP